MLTDRRYCYPLTITDFASRYLIACDALSTTKEFYAFIVELLSNLVYADEIKRQPGLIVQSLLR